MNKFFKDMGITIYIEDNEFDLNNLENPIKKTFTLKKLMLDPEYMKMKTINIQKLNSLMIKVINITLY